MSHLQNLQYWTEKEAIECQPLLEEYLKEMKARLGSILFVSTSLEGWWNRYKKSVTKIWGSSRFEHPFDLLRAHENRLPRRIPDDVKSWFCLEAEKSVGVRGEITVNRIEALHNNQLEVLNLRKRQRSYGNAISGYI
jgi:hypothetical protein